MATTQLARPRPRISPLPSPRSAAPVIDNGTRRDVLKGIGVLGAGWALAGCGGNDQVTTQDLTRTVTDARGPVEVPVDPQRVVVLYDDALDIALALGFPVVGGPGERGSATNPFPAHLPADLVAGIERIDTIGDGPYAEVIARLAPDLIVSNFVEAEGEETVATLSPLAPVFTFLTYEIGGWREGMRSLAETFGRTEQLGESFAEVDARTEQVRAAIAAGGRRVAIGTASAEGGIEVYADPSFEPLTLLLDLGFTQAPFSVSMSFDTLSEERLGDVDAEVFVFVQYGENPIDELVASNPLWNRSITTFTVPSSQTYFGPRSVLAFLDSVEAAFAR